MNFKILQIGKYSPNIFGGIETMIETIIDNCPQSVKNTLICFGNKNKNIYKKNQRILISKESFKLFSQPFGIKYLLDIKREIHNHNIVHLHLPNIFASLIVLLFKKKDTKIIVHWHSDILGKKILYPLVKIIETKILKISTYIICTSKDYAFTSKTLIRYTPKIKIIPIGISTKKISFKPKVKNKIHKIISNNQGKKIILTTGRLVGYKGFEYLIESFNFLDNKKILIIVGDGPDKSQLLRKSLNFNNIYLLSNLKKEELEYIYEKADLFCLPSISRAEAFGIVLIEAMKYGLPLITTNVEGSGMNSINKNNYNGLVVKKENSKELSRAINIICNSKRIQKKFSSNSKILFNKYFTDKKFIKKIVDVYKSALD